MMKELFEKTPYGGSVIGEVEDLQSLTRQQVWDFFKKFELGIPLKNLTAWLGAFLNLVKD